MDMIVISLLLSLIIAGIVYFSVKNFESALKKNIMPYVIILLLIILIIFYLLLYLSEYNRCNEITDTIIIWGIELFLIIFSIVEKIYRRFKL